MRRNRQEGRRLFEYVSLLRPAGVATTPPGAVGFRPSRDPRYPHGVVQYERPLRRADIDHFDLLPVDPMDPVNVRRILDAWRREAMERFVAGNDALRVEEGDGTTAFRTLTYSTRPGVEFQVTFWKPSGRFGRGRVEPTGHLDVNDFDRAAVEMLTRGERRRLTAALVPNA